MSRESRDGDHGETVHQNDHEPTEISIQNKLWEEIIPAVIEAQHRGDEEPAVSAQLTRESIEELFHLAALREIMVVMVRGGDNKRTSTQGKWQRTTELKSGANITAIDSNVRPQDRAEYGVPYADTYYVVSTSEESELLTINHKSQDKTLYRVRLELPQRGSHTTERLSFKLEASRISGFSNKSVEFTAQGWDAPTGQLSRVDISSKISSSIKPHKPA